MLRIILFIVFNIVLIITQIIITQGKNWKYGLVIPIFNAAIALFIALFTTTSSVSTVRLIDGVRYISNALRFGGFIWDFAWKLILFSIPAVVNFILYFTARNRSRKAEAPNLDKMKINDL